MTRSILTLAALFASLTVASLASAGHPVVIVRGHHGFGYGYGYRPLTYEESVLRGAADLTRARGHFNRNTAIARNIDQDTISKHLDNRLKSVQTRFEMRRINREFRDSQRLPRLSQQQLTTIAKQAAPKRLDGDQWQPALGVVYWPTALQGPQYAEMRQRMEQIVAQRQPGNLLTTDMKTVARKMTAQLKDEISQHDTNAYIAAKNFLRGLEVEASQAPRHAGIAAN